MNKDVMFSSKTDLWETPQPFFDALDNEFRFTLDVCALPENAKCEHYFTPEQDGLKQEWTGTVWCNPPYGREIGKWVEKAYLSALDGQTVVMLLPARTDTRWFHSWCLSNLATIRYIKGRLKFGGCKNAAPFPSMVVIFRKVPEGNLSIGAVSDPITENDVVRCGDCGYTKRNHFDIFGRDYCDYWRTEVKQDGFCNFGRKRKS